eukprot:634920-Alexandrium_andersonii.AAC.1
MGSPRPEGAVATRRRTHCRQEPRRSRCHSALPEAAVPRPGGGSQVPPLAGQTPLWCSPNRASRTTPS